MEHIIHILHAVLEAGVEFAVVAFEMIALVLLVIDGVKGIIHVIKHDEDISLDLLKGFSEGLTFLLGAEILKTVVLGDHMDLLMVAGVTLVRVILSVLIHWEMSLEHKEMEMAHHAQKMELATKIIDQKKKEYESK